MELRELRYLIAIEQTGNLSRAADELHVTPPALSYALRRLERELGVRIFARHTGGMRLTTAGRRQHGRLYGRPDLHWIPISDIEPLQVALAWMEPGSALVHEFAAVVRRLCAASE